MTFNALNPNLEQLVQVIHDGEMPEGGGCVNDGDVNLDALVEALDALDHASIDALLESTGGGVAAANAVADHLPRYFVEMEMSAYVGQCEVTSVAEDLNGPEILGHDDFEDWKQFSLIREVTIGSQSTLKRSRLKSCKASNDYLKPVDSLSLISEYREKLKRDGTSHELIMLSSNGAVIISTNVSDLCIPLSKSTENGLHGIAAFFQRQREIKQNNLCAERKKWENGEYLYAAFAKKQSQLRIDSE